MSGNFTAVTNEQLFAFVAAHPMAWIVLSAGNVAPIFMPVLLEADGDGRPACLIGHLPRRHPLMAALDHEEEARFLFTGPNAYIQPAWLADKNWAPTWNFCTAALRADIALWPDGLDNVLERTVALMEADRADRWTIAQLGPRYATLAAQLVAFRATVTEAAPRFKLGQDERPSVFEEILVGLSGHPLADWMRRERNAA